MEIKSNRITEKKDREKVQHLKIYLMFIGLNEAELGKVKIFSLRLKFQFFQTLPPTLQSELS